MLKIYIFFSFSLYLGLQAVDRDTFYQKMCEVRDAKEKSVHQVIKEFDIKNSEELINVLEQCKDLAWKNKDPKLRDLLHEEVIYQKQPWYQKRPKLAMTLVFFLTGVLCGIGASKDNKNSR